TTTIFRFVKKLGYEGYSEFVDDLSKAEEESRRINIPSIVQKDNYRDSYLKNIAEAVKVITDEKIEKFNSIMIKYPDIYIIAEGMSREVGRYFRRLLTSIGYNAIFPTESYEKEMVLKRIKKEDVLLVLSYTGDNVSVIHEIEKIFAISTPTIISFTRADNNAIQNMSDLNFYVFADEIDYGGIDVTSRIGMIAIMETLLYKRITK
ncbi:MAG: MurR/RpiR family transcriptional regulator, partial [Bacillota bacterium]|nr:MurR/RpiR family transcriptional regulator [Bacillota bacterium]